MTKILQQTEKSREIDSFRHLETVCTDSQKQQQKTTKLKSNVSATFIVILSYFEHINPLTFSWRDCYPAVFLYDVDDCHHQEKLLGVWQAAMCPSRHPQWTSKDQGFRENVFLPMVSEWCQNLWQPVFKSSCSLFEIHGSQARSIGLISGKSSSFWQIYEIICRESASIYFSIQPLKEDYSQSSQHHWNSDINKSQSTHIMASRKPISDRCLIFEWEPWPLLPSTSTHFVSVSLPLIVQTSP